MRIFRIFGPCANPARRERPLRKQDSAGGEDCLQTAGSAHWHMTCKRRHNKAGALCAFVFVTLKCKTIHRLL